MCPEKYQPSPSEIRAAENSMNDRQRELTETREDSLHEGREQKAAEKSYSKEDYDRVYEFLEDGKLANRDTKIDKIATLIGKNQYVVMDILKDIGTLTISGNKVRLHMTDEEFDAFGEIDTTAFLEGSTEEKD